MSFSFTLVGKSWWRTMDEKLVRLVKHLFTAMQSNYTHSVCFLLPIPSHPIALN